MAKKKRTNPNRIPIALEKIDKDELVASVSHGNMFYAWLLTLPALIQQEGVSKDRVIELWTVVNDYMAAPSFTGERLHKELRAIAGAIGSHEPYPQIGFERVRTLADLETVRRKLKKNALYDAVCMILIGLQSTGEFEQETLRRIYVNADLTLAEIEHGRTTYDELLEWGKSEGIIIEEKDDEMSLEG